MKAAERGPGQEWPSFLRGLFGAPAFAWVWLLVRAYLGYQWFEAGWHKLTGTGWIDGGTSLRSYWERAVAIPKPPARPPISYEWYRDFLQFMLGQGWHEWFAWLIVVGELAVGIALLLGAFTAVAALFGAFMNMSFMLAGSASTNPVLFTLAMLLVLAWRVGGYWGLDRWLLPALGTPWRPGAVLRRRALRPALGGAH